MATTVTINKLEKTKDKFIGIKVNNLIILDVLKKNDYRGYYFACICDCGKEVVTRKSNLVGKKKQLSCGCNKESFTKRILPNNQSAFNSLFGSYKSAAKKRNLSFKLNEQEFKKLIYSNCHYCNKSPEQKVKSKKSLIIVNGIDRKNNDNGYELNNCLPCCKICNHAKHVLSYEQFLNLVNSISKNLKLEK